MPSRLALLAVLAALAACDAPKQAPVPTPPPAPQEPAVVLSAQQIQERSTLCERKAREAFKRDSGGEGITEFAHHYSTKRDTCFYLLTVTRQETISRKLLDINENETYGEYSGAGENWTVCRVESLHCASQREWEVLVGAYMHD